MTDLILRPSGQSSNPRVRWALQIRDHYCCGEVEYATIAHVTDAVARAIVDSGAPYFLFHDEQARVDWRAELESMEPDEMSPAEMRLEIMRLRAELATATAAIRKAGE